MTHWSNCFYTHESFTLITYNISFIFTYLLHSERDSTLYMNARVCQQLSTPYLWNWSLTIKKKKKHLYVITLLSIHFIHLSTSFFFQSQNSVYIFPHIYPSRSLCPWPTFCPSWEYYCAGFKCRTSSFAKSTWFSFFLFMLNRCTYLWFAFLFNSQLSSFPDKL